MRPRLDCLADGVSALTELLDERITPSRQSWGVDFPVDSPELPPAIILSCNQAGVVMVVIPSVGEEFLHFELQMFANGDVCEPESSSPGDGVLELTLRRPTESDIVCL